MAIKTFTTGEVLTAADTNTYLGNAGLVYVTSVTVGSGVTSVSVPNAFSSTYDNYRVILNSTSSAATSVGIQLGSSITEYYGALFYMDWTVNTGIVQNTNNGNQMRYIGGSTGAGASLAASCDIFSPFSSAFTRFANGMYLDTTSIGTSTGLHKVATSYTSCNFVIGSGTITGGTAIVYGYRKP